MELVNKIGGGFDEHDLVLGQAVANQIAVAIHNIQLTEAAIKAERLAAIGQAITGVAHCVKNMLNGLTGGLFVLKTNIKQSAADISDQGFDMLERNMKRLSGLVQDMLTYSKDREPEYEVADVNEMAASVVDLMSVKAEERGLQLRYDPGENVGTAEMDSKGIYRCTLNLVSNALDACEDEGTSVEVSTCCADDGQVVVAIADEGCGMDEETLKSIFQPFFSKKGSKGTGLGLSVTQKIIQEHGGSIQVDSAPGEGSTFRIYLPRRAKSAKK